ncbi:hypothetical protein B0H14DRAFT_3502777 [Mycena olivaceomarginata]|nr:hypothetical protein B0H14DRAFT_3502777 [Mycena olivaceomarginata]
MRVSRKRDGDQVTLAPRRCIHLSTPEEDQREWARQGAYIRLPHISTLPAPASGAETAHKSTRATRIPHLALRAPQEKKKGGMGRRTYPPVAHPRLALRAPQEARRVNEDGAIYPPNPVTHPCLALRAPQERKVRGSAHIHSVTDPLHPLHSRSAEERKLKSGAGTVDTSTPASCPRDAQCETAARHRSRDRQLWRTGASTSAPAPHPKPL